MTERDMVAELKDLVDEAVAKYNSTNASLSIYAGRYGRPSFASKDDLQSIRNRASYLRNRLFDVIEAE